MILARLVLENYKQFRARTELTPPEGAVGVVGSNGSGKTTIFEAILWAFFGARGGGPRFANDSIPWSGGSTADRSLVEVTVDMGGISYTVSRSLHKNKTTARVVGEDGEEVTSGPSEVAAWVQEHILGMDRVAFEATFFARQKELEFFAGVTGVERQREVARILRINQVEDAQKLLRTDKNDLLKDARRMEQELEEADHDSLVADLDEQKKIRASLETKAKELRAAFEKRGEELEKARAEAARMDALYREHNGLDRQRAKAVSDRDVAAERAAELTKKLRGFDEDEKRVAALEPRAGGMDEISAEMEVLEAARRREERKSEARKELHRQRKSAYDASRRASEEADSLDRDGRELFPAWPGAAEYREDEFGFVREVVRSLAEDAETSYLRSEEDARKIRDIADKYASLAKKNERLENGKAAIEAERKKVEGVEAEIREVSGEVSGDGSLDERIAALRKRRDSMRGESSQKAGLAEAEEREAEKMANARRMVEDSDERAKCPTCRRGFEKDEHAEVVESLSKLEESSRKKADEFRNEIRRLEAEAKRVFEEIEAGEEAKAKLYELKEKRSVAVERRGKWEEAYATIEAEAREIRERISGAPEPSSGDVDAARDRAGRLRKLRDARPALESLVSKHDDANAAAEEREGEIEALSGGEPYDAARYDELASRLSEIQNIVGEIKSLRSRLEGRPSAEESLARANESREAAATETERLEKEMRDLGFDEERHVAARENSTEAERLREEARDLRDEAERELRGAEHVVASLERDVERNEKKRKEADGKASEAASLNDMDKLFSEFYTELTVRVRPQLQREASDLVKTLTDNRYEKMEFDENYGVRLYDGLSDSYEISRFSGGEADVASLCARVALSKMISGKGSGALGFIVLDEVFGALDASRRQNVLHALDRLKRTFGQLFVISHVSDVQESVLFDETWFIEEDEEGKSSVRKVRPDVFESGSRETLRSASLRES